MWDRIGKLMKKPEEEPKNDIGSAVAAMLVYTASLDQDYGEEEREHILAILRRQTWDENTTPEQLFFQGEQMAKDTLDCYGFLRTLNAQFNDEDRLHLMEMMWQVVVVDGVLDEYEMNMMRRIAGLLGISDQESGQIRRTVLEFK